MDFSGLVKGVQDFWDFIWPPIICLIALIGITFYAAPILSSTILSKLGSWKPTDRSQIQFIKVSKRFGFDKLLPIICAFFLIFFLDVVRNIVVMGGQSIPPVISYTPSRIILENKDRDTIQCLWKSRAEATHLQKEAAIKAGPPQDASDIPNALPPDDDQKFYIDPRYGYTGFEDVSEIIERAVADATAEHKDSPAVMSLHTAEDQIGTAHKIFSGLKFLFLYSLVVSFLEIRLSSTRGRVAIRALTLLLVILAGTFIFFLRYLKTTEHLEETKIYVAETYPVKGSLDCEIPESDEQDLNKLFDRTVKHEEARREKWWSLQFPSMKIFTWSWKQLTDDHPGPSYAP